MPWYALCPDCGAPMEVEPTHNGVMAVWHGIHCGWGQDGFATEDVVRAETLSDARIELTTGKVTP